MPFLLRKVDNHHYMTRTKGIKLSKYQTLQIHFRRHRSYDEKPHILGVELGMTAVAGRVFL